MASAARMVVTVRLPDGTHSKVAAGGAQRVHAVAEQLLGKLGVSAACAPLFRLARGAAPLDPQQTLLHAGVGADADLRLVLCAPRRLRLQRLCAAALSLLFRALRRDLVDGLTQASDFQCVRLAALQLQAEVGDFVPGRHKPAFLASLGMHTLLPPRMHAMNGDRLQRRILAVYRSLQGLSAEDAQRAYLAAIFALPSYGIVLVASKLEGRTVFMGVAEQGVYRMDTQGAPEVCVPFGKLSDVTVDGAQVSVASADGGAVALAFTTTPEAAEQFRGLYMVHRALHPDTPETAPRPFGMPSPDLFEPVSERRFPGAVPSRLHCLLRTYEAECRTVGCVLNEKLLTDVGFHLDAGVPMGTVALAEQSLDDGAATAVFVALRKAMSFLPDDDASEFVDNLNVVELQLSNNTISVACLGALEALLRVCTSLLHIDLSWNFVDNVGAKALAPGLSSGDLRSLNLSHNSVGNKGAVALLEALRSSNLDSLNLAHNRVSDKGLLKLAEAVHDGLKLRALDISANRKCSAKSYEAVLGALAGCPALRSVGLASLGQSGRSLPALVHFVQNAPLTIERLALGGDKQLALNDIFSLCARFTALRELELELVVFDESICKTLGTACAALPRLERVCLTDCSTRALALPLFLDACTGVRHLTVSGGSLPLTGLNKFLHQLESVSLVGCSLSATDLMLMANALEGGALVELKVRDNAIDADVVLRILQATLALPTVRKLALDHCGLNDGCVRSLCDCLDGSAVEELELRDASFSSGALHMLESKIHALGNACRLRTLDVQRSFAPDTPHGNLSSLVESLRL